MLIIFIRQRLSSGSSEEKSTMSRRRCQDISSLYYTYVPYSCGRSKPPVISSADQISKCLQRLEDLENISINVRAVEGPSNWESIG